MREVVLVIHVLIALIMVAVILLQRSEGGALGIGGGGGGLMSARGVANILTRVTTALAAMFMLTSVFLSVLAAQASGPASILDETPPPAIEQPEQPQLPEVPVSDD